MNSDVSPSPTIPPADPAGPPMPRIKKMRWPFPIIWIVPLAAACVAAYFLNQHHQETGTQITILFTDASGIRPGETAVSLRGVTIGHVRTVDFNEDHSRAIAHVQLQTSAKFLAKSDTLFWLVKPEVSLQNISGLSTIVSGPYIDCRPGSGGGSAGESREFNALPGAPDNRGDGIRLILWADQIAQLSVDSPVNYRGIQVGSVKDIRLSSNASSVNVTVVIWDRYKSLVRANSQFWMIKGADLEGSLLGGVSLKLGSVQNLLIGGVSFATPEKKAGDLAPDGSKFVLHDKVDEDWLKWKAQIDLPPDATLPSDSKPGAQAEQKQLPTLQKE